MTFRHTHGDKCVIFASPISRYTFCMLHRCLYSEANVMFVSVPVSSVKCWCYPCLMQIFLF